MVGGLPKESTDERYWDSKDGDELPRDPLSGSPGNPWYISPEGPVSGQSEVSPFICLLFPDEMLLVSFQKSCMKKRIPVPRVQGKLTRISLFFQIYFAALCQTRDRAM